jgi:hypothetical protein
MLQLKQTDAAAALTALQKKMLPCLTLPLPANMPTSLRYSFAKYDADAVAEAYRGLVKLAEQGLLENA